MSVVRKCTALFLLAAFEVFAQGPAPLYVVTYVEVKPPAKSEAAALLKSYRDATRREEGNLRSEAVQHAARPGQFVLLAAWKDQKAYEAHAAAASTREFRDKLQGLRNSPADDRFHNALSVGDLVAAAQWNVPPESQRCPSKWGAGDERGSGNHMKNPEVVLRGARLIKTGEVIELSHVLGPGMAFSGTRIFNLHTKRTFMNTGRNTRGSNEEVVTSEIGQVGTQFDGFAHQSHGDSHYNCFKTSEIA